MHPNDGRVVSNFIIQALNNEDISVFGKGDQTRSFCFVSDLIRGMTSLMNSEDQFIGPVNIGNPHEISIFELAETIIELTNSKSKIIHNPLPVDDPVRRCPDISLAQEKLNWTPKISLKEGLEITVSYFDNLLKKAANGAFN
nr:GDP-mannose 4,6-dehydratase [Sneathiella glossodoripedis]